MMGMIFVGRGGGGATIDLEINPTEIAQHWTYCRQAHLELLDAHRAGQRGPALGPLKAAVTGAIFSLFQPIMYGVDARSKSKFSSFLAASVVLVSLAHVHAASSKLIVDNTYNVEDIISISNPPKARLVSDEEIEELRVASSGELYGEYLREVGARSENSFDGVAKLFKTVAEWFAANPRARNFLEPYEEQHSGDDGAEGEGSVVGSTEDESRGVADGDETEDEEAFWAEPDSESVGNPSSISDAGSRNDAHSVDGNELSIGDAGKVEPVGVGDPAPVDELAASAVVPAPSEGASPAEAPAPPHEAEAAAHTGTSASPANIGGGAAGYLATPADADAVAAGGACKRAGSPPPTESPSKRRQ